MASPRAYGSYDLVARLAVGGMAEIFLAREKPRPGAEPESVTRLCVVKRILDHLCVEPRFVQMFLDEARIVAQMDHRNIVQIFDLGQVAEPDSSGPPSYYIAMEYLPGESLGAICRRGARAGDFIRAEHATLVMARVLDALAYAHALAGKDGQPLHVVHRDVAPKNVVVTYDGEVKLVDFGIAKAAVKTETTQVGIVKGTFNFMSPEQARGRPLDGRSDLFSCGVVLYELLTGERLFAQEDSQECMRAICDAPIKPPREVFPALPEELERVILRALERDPARRYQSAAEMRDDLEAWLEGRADRADLAAYMQLLFADRIAEAKAVLSAALGDEPDSFVFERAEPDEEAGGAASVASSLVVRRKTAEGAAAEATSPGETGPLLEPPTSAELRAKPPPRRALLIGFALAPLAVAAGALAALGLRGREAGPAAVDAGISAERQPVPAAPAPAAPAPLASAPPASALPAPAPAEAKKPDPPGYLTLVTDPWSTIYLGARRLGDTPLYRFPLPPGTHVLTAVNTEKGLSRQIKVTIASGRPRTMKAKLK